MHEKWSGDYRKTKWLKTPLDYSLKHARITSIHHLVSRRKRKKFKQVCGYCDWFRWKCDGINRKVNLCEKFHQTTTKRTNTPKRMLRYTCIYFRGASTTAAVVALLLLSVRRVSQKLSSSSSPPKGCFPTDESPRFEFMLLLVGGASSELPVIFAHVKVVKCFFWTERWCSSTQTAFYILYLDTKRRQGGEECIHREEFNRRNRNCIIVGCMWVKLIYSLLRYDNL